VYTENFAAFVWFTPSFPSLSPVSTVWHGYCFVCNTDAQYTNNSILLGTKRIMMNKMMKTVMAIAAFALVSATCWAAEKAS
jgi:hypothetical protein